MNEIYKPINPIERGGADNALNELKISVRYDKGSMNYFTNQVNKRGLYVHFSPVQRCLAVTRKVVSKSLSVNLDVPPKSKPTTFSAVSSLWLTKSPKSGTPRIGTAFTKW